MSNAARVLFVCSSGGHLDQLVALLPPPENTDVAVATFLKPDAIDKVSSLRNYGLYWPTNRSIKALMINTWRAFSILSKERPDVIVSSGAAAAVAFFYVGKLFYKTKNVFIECIDRIDNTTLTARLVGPTTDLFICQWDTQLANTNRRQQITRSR